MDYNDDHESGIEFLRNSTDLRHRRMTNYCDENLVCKAREIDEWVRYIAEMTYLTGCDSVPMYNDSVLVKVEGMFKRIPTIGLLYSIRHNRYCRSIYAVPYDHGYIQFHPIWVNPLWNVAR